MMNVVKKVTLFLLAVTYFVRGEVGRRMVVKGINRKIEATTTMRHYHPDTLGYAMAEIAYAVGELYQAIGLSLLLGED